MMTAVRRVDRYDAKKRAIDHASWRIGPGSKSERSRRRARWSVAVRDGSPTRGGTCPLSSLDQDGQDNDGELKNVMMCAFGAFAGSRGTARNGSIELRKGYARRTGF